MGGEVVRTTRPKGRNIPATRVEIARYLVLRWAPGADLVVKETHGVAGVCPNKMTEPGPDEIEWHPSDGLTALFHEIGHLRIGRRISGAMGEGKLGELAEEALAWHWAEFAARHENVWFDYRFADRCFSTYAKFVPVSVRWRYRDSYRGEKEAE